jgi:hypothetical protein
VLSRLLAGQDYVLRSVAGGVSLVLVGSSAADSTAMWSGQLPAGPGSRLIALRQARARGMLREP